MSTEPAAPKPIRLGLEVSDDVAARRRLSTLPKVQNLTTSPAEELTGQERAAPNRPHSEDPGHRARLGMADWKSIAQRTAARVKSDRVTMAAGSLAYHWFLALFPAMIAALGLLALLRVGTGTVHHLTHAIATALPSGGAGVFNSAVTAATEHHPGSATAVIVGVVVALWSASSGMAVLEQALDIAYEVPNDRGFMTRRLLGLPLMVLVAVVGGCSAALIVFGQPIGSAINGVVPLHGEVFLVVWTVLRWVSSLALLTLLFSAIYSVAPNRPRPQWKWISGGGVLATAGFLVSSLAFSFYVSSFGSYAKTYGSLAGVAIVIFWFWLVGLAVLLGGELNAEIERGGTRPGGRSGPLGRPERATDFQVQGELGRLQR